MSTTVLDALQNARLNFETIGKMGLKNSTIFMVAMFQLNNAITALENNKGPNDVIQEHMFDQIDIDIQREDEIYGDQNERRNKSRRYR